MNLEIWDKVNLYNVKAFDNDSDRPRIKAHFGITINSECIRCRNRICSGVTVDSEGIAVGFGVGLGVTVEGGGDSERVSVGGGVTVVSSRPAVRGCISLQIANDLVQSQI
jgi:hypothetical protein